MERVRKKGGSWENKKENVRKEERKEQKDMEKEGKGRNERKK